jgi:hypothetical protein
MQWRGRTAPSPSPEGEDRSGCEILRRLMSQENVDKARDFIAAYNRRDFDAAVESFDPEVKVEAYQDRAKALEAVGLSEQEAHTDS